MENSIGLVVSKILTDIGKTFLLFLDQRLSPSRPLGKLVLSRPPTSFWILVLKRKSFFPLENFCWYPPPKYFPEPMRSYIVKEDHIGSAVKTLFWYTQQDRLTNILCCFFLIICWKQFYLTWINGRFPVIVCGPI